MCASTQIKVVNVSSFLQKKKAWIKENTQKCAVVDVFNAPCGFKVHVGMCRMIGARSRAE